MNGTRTRLGLSILEIVVVLAIMMLLIAMTLTAIQKVRTSAVRLKSENNLRQICLGLHQLASQQPEPIKNLARSDIPNKMYWTEQPLLFSLVPYVQGPVVVPPPNATPDQLKAYLDPKVKAYLSPADPTLNSNPALADTRGKCIYVYNIRAIQGILNLPLAFRDGTSSTLAFAEHYYYSEGTASFLDFTAVHGALRDDRIGGGRRSTFADQGWRDVLPVTNVSTGKTIASVRGRTFQVQPTPEEADGYTPQTPFAAGLPVAFFDGSVRTLSPGIDESIFWSLVTHDSGEVIGDF